MRIRRFDRKSENKIRLGRRGERVAEKLLRKAGLIVLARNWRGGGGELDLALLEGNTLVFVEVKTRAAGFDDPRHPVSVAQRQRIRQAAHAFRRRYAVPDLAARFDLVTVTLGSSLRPGARKAESSAQWHQNYQRNDVQQEQR